MKEFPAYFCKTKKGIPMRFLNFFLLVSFFFFLFHPFLLSQEDLWEEETPYEIVTGTGYSPDKKIAFNHACQDMLRQALIKRSNLVYGERNSKKIDSLSYKLYIESKPDILEWDGKKIVIKGKVNVSKMMDALKRFSQEKDSSEYNKYFSEKENPSSPKKTQDRKEKDSSEYDKYFSEEERPVQPNPKANKPKQELPTKEPPKSTVQKVENSSVSIVVENPNDPKKIKTEEAKKQPVLQTHDPKKVKEEAKKQPVPQTHSSKTDKSSTGKPIEIARSLIQASKEKKEEDWGLYCSEDIQKSLAKIKNILGDNSCFFSLWQVYALASPIEEKIQGNTAFVKVAGIANIESFFFIQEKGQWKYQGYILSSGKKCKTSDSLERMYLEFQKSPFSHK